jgi:hypothetical protein
MKIEQDKVAKLNNQKQNYLSNALTLGNVQVFSLTYIFKNYNRTYISQAPLLMLGIEFALSFLVFLCELSFATRSKMKKKQKLFFGNADNNK